MKERILAHLLKLNIDGFLCMVKQSSFLVDGCIPLDGMWRTSKKNI
jgi:hypothetical protein